MTSTKPVSVNAMELRNAFDFVSMGAGVAEHSAYICLDTGQIYTQAEGMEEEHDLPEDLETSDRYLAVPHKNDLDLGRRLVMAFINQELPADYDTVAAFFQRRGAYARLKDLLAARGKLNAWYDFEERSTDNALRAWCDEAGISLVGGESTA